MRAWGRRHLAGLVALLVVIPALAAIMIGVPVWERDSRMSEPVEIADGESGSASGLAFTVRAAGEFRGGTGSIDLPETASFIAAVIDVEPAAGDATDVLRPATCSLSLTAPGREEITWNPSFDTERYGYLRGGDEYATSCDPTATDAYSIEVVFLVPADVLDDVAVDVTLQESGVTRTLRLELPAAAPGEK